MGPFSTFLNELHLSAIPQTAVSFPETVLRFRFFFPEFSQNPCQIPTHEHVAVQKFPAVWRHPPIRRLADTDPFETVLQIHVPLAA